MMTRTSINPIQRLLLLVFVSALAAGFTLARAATITVSSSADSGAGSLRSAVSAATAGDTISITYTGTIALATQITIDKDLTIQGPGSGSLTLDGGSSHRIFLIQSGTVLIEGLTIANGVSQGTTGSSGAAGGGGGGGGGAGGGMLIDSAAKVTVQNVVFNNCLAKGGAGGSSTGGTNYAGAAGGAGKIDISTAATAGGTSFWASGGAAGSGFGGGGGGGAAGDGAGSVGGNGGSIGGGSGGGGNSGTGSAASSPGTAGWMAGTGAKGTTPYHGSGGGGGGGAGIGGAIFVNDAWLILKTVTFTNNTATGGNGGSGGSTSAGAGQGKGGAVCIKGTKPVEVYECTFTGNAASSDASTASPLDGTTHDNNDLYGLFVDGPLVQNVTSTSPNGIYGESDTISIQVQMSEPLTVTGTPTLTLETGDTDEAATYTGLTGGNTLNFSYTVVLGDGSADLDYTGTNALSLGGGTITYLYNSVNYNGFLTLQAPGASGSLGANKDLQIAAGPTIRVMNTDDSGAGSLRQAMLDAGIGSTINFDASLAGQTITLSTPVTVDKMVIIDGSTCAGLVISGGDATEIFNVTAGTPTFYGLTLAHGSATVGGGIYVSGGATLTVDSCTIRDCSATGTSDNWEGYGSAIISDSSIVRIVNSTITGNTANVSGAVCDYYNSSITIDNSTIADNTGVGNAGGLDAYSGTITVTNSILVGNTGPDGTLFDEYSATFASGGNNVVDESLGSTFNQSGDLVGQDATTQIKLAALADNGGPTQTRALGTGSVAIDAGSNANAPTYDQRGLTRIVGSSIDVGAYEVQAAGPPTISSSSPADGATGVDASGNLTITFNAAVSAGTGSITLRNVGTNATIESFDVATSGRVTGWGTTTLTIDPTSDLPEGAHVSVQIGATAINDGSGHDFAGIGDDTTLDFTVANVAPTVSSVGVPGNGTYLAGQNLHFTVHMSEAVTVSGTPRIALTFASGTVYADYASGSGSSDLVFTYNVNPGDLDADGITVGALTLNGGTIQDGVGNDAVLTLNSVGPTIGVRVDAVAPTVSSVSVPANATYATGQNLNFTVNFSENVTVNTGGGTPSIALTLESGGTVAASYLSGSGTSALVFRHTITSGESDTDGIAIGSSIALNSGTIQDAAGNNAALTLNSVGSLAGVLVDGVAPTFTSVAVSSDATYIPGQYIYFTVACSEPVTVNTGGGTPYLPITLDTGGTVHADYRMGSGGSSLSFRYQVKSGDEDLTGITVGSAIVANGGTLGDAASNSAVLTLNGVASTTGVKVDGRAPTVTSVDVPAAGYYRSGQALDFAVHFSEPVTVASGTPYVDVNIGGGSRIAAYRSGSGTDTLNFRYTVGGTDTDQDGIGVVLLTANGATIRDSAGNDADVTLNSVGATTGVYVDTTAPTVSSVTVPANKTYIVGENMDFVVNLSEGCNVDTTTGSMRLPLTLETGGTVYADYNARLGSMQLKFRYTVGAGVADTDGIAVGGALDMNGGRIYDPAGNDLVTTLNSVGATSGVKVDGIAPSVTSVDVPADKTYGEGQNLDFTVNYDEAVTVTGTPRIALTLEYGSGRTADYVSGSGTTALVFRYAVPVGDGDSDGIGVAGTIDLNGGTLKDASGNDAGTTLNNLPATTGVLVDARASVIQSVDLPADATYVAGQNLDFVVHFDEPVLLNPHFNEPAQSPSGGMPRLAVTLDTGGTVYAVYASGDGTATWTFRYTVVSGNSDSDGIGVGSSIDLNGSNLADAAGNMIDRTLPTLGSTAGILIDAITPTVTSVGVPADATYAAGQTLTFTVHFSELVNVTGTPRLGLTLDGGGLVGADYVSGSGSNALVFRYAVVAGNADGDGIAVGGAIDLNGGTLKDAASNAVDTTLNGVGSTAGVKVDTQGPVLNPGTLQIAERSANGAPVGTIGATDASTPVVFALDDDAQGRFAIGVGSGEVTLADTAKVNYEAATSHKIVVRAVDAVSNVTTQSVTVAVLDRNDAPALLATTAQMTAIDEDTTDSLGMGVADLLAGRVLDQDAGAVGGVAVVQAQSLHGGWQYSVDGGTNWTGFTTPTTTNARLIGTGAGGRIRFVPARDFNGLADGLVVRAWDRTAGTEGATADTSVNGDTTAFSSGTMAVSLTVNAINDDPVIHLPAAQMLDEGSSLTLSAARSNAITISDVDIADGAASITLAVTGGTLTLGGTDGIVFAAGDSGLGVARTSFRGTTAAINRALDGLRYVPGAYVNGLKTLTVTVSDQGQMGAGGGGDVRGELTMNVSHVNHAPYGLALIGRTVAENAPAGTLVGTLSASDHDLGDVLSYRVFDGYAEPGSTVPFATDGNRLVTTAPLDFETHPSYAVRVEVRDQGGLTQTEIYTISIENRNEAPTGLAIDHAAVNENQRPGATVGTLSATDPDAGDTFTYALVGGAGDSGNGQFRLVGATLRTARPLDYELTPSLSVRVRVTDAGGLGYERVLTIAVGNTNDVPSGLDLSETSVQEKQPAGTLVGVLSALDQDAGDTLVYRLVGGTGSSDNGAFAIAGNRLVTARELDASAQALMGIRVQADDGHGGRTERPFSIAVTAKADTDPPAFAGGPAIDQVTSGSASVGWTATEPVTAKVEYGATSALGQTLTLGTATATGRVTIPGLAPNSEVYVRVSITDAAGNGPVASPVLSARTLAGGDAAAPVIIDGPLATSINAHQAVIAWRTDEPSDSVVMFGNDAAGYSSAEDRAPTTEHRITLSDLASSTTYHVRVSSTDTDGNGPTSSELDFTTEDAPDTLAPVMVEYPIVLSATDTTVVIAWKTDEPATSIVEFGVAGTSATRTIALPDLVQDHRVTLTGLAAGTGYTFVVRSIDAAGNGPLTSTQLGFTTEPAADTTPPVVLNGPNIVALSNTKATVAWTTDEPADSVVRYGTGGSLNLMRTNPDRVTRHQITLVNLVPGQSYTFEISSTDASGNKVTLGGIGAGEPGPRLADATAFLFTTPTAADVTSPTLVAGPAVLSASNTWAIIAWKTNEIADSRVSFGKTGTGLKGFSGDISRVSDHLIVLTNLAADTEYEYQAASSDLSGNIGRSAVLSFRTAPAPDTTAPAIQSPEVTRLSTSGARIGWQTDEPASTQLVWGTSPAALTRSTADAGLASAHLLDLTRLAPGTTYYFQIVSVDAAGNRTTSQVASFTTQWETPPPDLKLTLAGTAGPLTNGGGIGYTFTVTNQGGHLAAGVAVAATLSPWVGVTDGGGWSDAGSGRMTWTIGSLEAGASTSATLRVAIGAIGSVPTSVNTIVTSATATDDGSTGLDPQLADNTAQASTLFNPSASTVVVQPQPETASWSLTGPFGTTNGTGSQTVANLPAGSYRIDWQPLLGWLAPPSQTKTVAVDGQVSFAGEYAPEPQTTLSVTAPAALAGSTQTVETYDWITVRWQSGLTTETARYGVTLWHGGTEAVADLGSTEVTGSDGELRVRLPRVPAGTGYRIAVTNLDDRTIRAETLGTLTIVDKPGILVLSPVAGDHVRAGDPLSVHWRSQVDFSGTAVWLYLMRDGKVVNNLGVYYDPTGDQVTTVTLPKDLPSGTYQIRASSSWDGFIWTDSGDLTIEGKAAAGPEWTYYQ